VAARGLRQELRAAISFLILGNEFCFEDLNAFRHNFIPNNTDLSGPLSLEDEPGLIVVDVSGELPAELTHYINEKRSAGAKILALDRVPTGITSDLMFIPSFREPSNLSNTGNRLVFGWDCFLIEMAENLQTWKSGHRVLALTGGSDATGLGRTWPTLLNMFLPDSTEVHWVVGPFSDEPDWPQEQRIKFKRHHAPERLANLMDNTNYAITVFGVSFFELLHRGVPTVVFSPYANRDVQELVEIAIRGLAIVAENEEDATTKLVSLMTDPDKAGRLSQIGRSTLSKTGAHRFCDEIKMLLNN